MQNLSDQHAGHTEIVGVLAAAGAARPAGERPAARHLRGHRVVLDLRLGRGAAEATALGCDLSADYVAINAHYRS
ncbi:MAG: bifunctional ornithine acetyltransferase/N-acetylglutamate synthase [Acidobacteriia bacterium]|nr:bifunctional ornithine acetyltransferase/N-acetylglutamate synthase [Terriglobia bacterium]